MLSVLIANWVNHVHSYAAPMPYMTCRLKEWDADPRRGKWTSVPATRSGESGFPV